MLEPSVPLLVVILLIACLGALTYAEAQSRRRP